MFWTTLVIAIREIRRNAMRSTLTTLGMVIGVAAVIAMVTLGQGATDKVTSEIASLGNNMLIVMPGSERRGPLSAGAQPLAMEDARAIVREVPAAARVAPTASRGVLAVYGNSNWSTVATGSNNDYFAVRGFAVAKGRIFSDVELLGGTPACVLGETVRRELFGPQDPIGASIRVGAVACTVIGLLEPKGQSTFGADQDDFLVMPLSAFQRRVSGNTDVTSIFVSAVNDRSTSKAKEQIMLLMRERRRIAAGQREDFAVQDMKEITKTVQAATGALTALLGAIAAVSLIVGGIGIMNIMLVSVTERTREIGIRLAIGAYEREVLAQFLVESAALSAFGGVLGIALGLGGSYAAARGLGLPFPWLPEIIVIAFVFSASVGVGFGYYPARKAAHLNPIEALRHE
jgi:putative ABC transport system permease protein